MKKFVIVYGDLFEGIQGVIGPFETEDKAEIYGESHNLGHYEWMTYELENPKEE